MIGLPLMMSLLLHGQIAGPSPPSREVEVSLDLEDVETPTVLDEVARRSGARIIVDPRVVGRTRIQVERMPWRDALDLVLAENDLEARVAGDGIVVVSPSGVPKAWINEEGITPPRVVRHVPPRIPFSGRATRGITIIDAIVDESGRVRETRVIKPLPHGLSEAAVAALRQWIFEPATKDGQPVRAIFHFTTRFESH